MGCLVCSWCSLCATLVLGSERWRRLAGFTSTRPLSILYSIPAISTFNPHRLTVLKWFEDACVCVLVYSTVIEQNELIYIYIYVDMPTCCILQVHYVHTHTHTHTHILVPFEDPEPTGLKVDIASILRHDFSSSLFKTLSTADFRAWLWHQQCLMICLCSCWSHTWLLGVQFCFKVAGCPCTCGDPRQLRHTRMWGSTFVVLVANLTFGIWS